MGIEDSFTRLIRERARRADEERQRDMIRETAIAEILFRDKLRWETVDSGSPIENFFEPEDVNYCLDFIERVRAADFRGASVYNPKDRVFTAAHPKLGINLEPSWIGYPIGITGQATPVESGSVWLCADSKLRDLYGRDVKRVMSGEMRSATIVVSEPSTHLSGSGAEVSNPGIYRSYPVFAPMPVGEKLVSILTKLELL